MPHRSDFNYSSSSLDGGFDAYSIPSVQPALQHQDFQMSTSLYGNSEAARQWPALGQQNRSGNSYDQDLALKYSSSGLNYGDTGFSSALSSADTPSLFPNMGNLASTLPIHPRNNDRVLPNPRSALLSSTNDTITGAHTLMIEDIVPPVSQRRGIKSSSLWSAERLEGGGSLTPTSAESSCAAAYAVPHVINKPSDSPPESHQTSFGYMTHTPPTTSTTPTTESDSTKPSSCVPMIENLLSASSAYDSGLSNDNLLRRDFSSSSLYTYSTGNGSRCDSQSSFSEATLLNGQPYISQLRQPHHQHAENCDIARRNSSEIAARDSHRASTASIASIGSSRR
ncbi:hypothetical protein MMC19_003103 [Ptychographa xylographoides]|nr:hypothetical protein [Ptychographa xylographoides]